MAGESDGSGVSLEQAVRDKVAGWNGEGGGRDVGAALATAAGNARADVETDVKKPSTPHRRGLNEGALSDILGYALESGLYTSGRVDDTVQRLVASGKTYEKDGALWLRTTDDGDDKDRVMRKSDGSYTYFVPDVAYHIAKWERGFHKVVNIQGTDHHGTIARVRAGLQAANVGIPQGSYFIELVYDTTKSDKHAFDYLTTFNRTVAGADPCAGVACSAGGNTAARWCRPLPTTRGLDMASAKEASSPPYPPLLRRSMTTTSGCRQPSA